MTLSKAKKGFYLVSPFLGFMFFLITVAIASFFVSEDHQSIETAQAGVITKLSFAIQAMHADATDVFLQNYLQEALDAYDLDLYGAPRTNLAPRIVSRLESMTAPYEKIYLKWGITCETSHRLYSLLHVRLMDLSSKIITYTDPSSGALEYCGNVLCPNKDTAIRPLIGQFSLNCKTEEPPAQSAIPIEGRWYYLDAKCICCQYPFACEPWSTDLPKTFEDCRGEGSCFDLI
jgi:hypothetical protein